VPRLARPATPARFVDGYLPALLTQASHLISSEFHAVVRAAGLSVPEWRVLATLADGREVTVGQLAQITVIKQPTLTRLLDRMVERGQVERVAHASDRRYTPVRITRAGGALVARLIQQAREHEARVLAPFGLRAAEELKSTLRRMIELHRGPG
jgi:DNA-binding MarR family transcriptional regulator